MYMDRKIEPFALDDLPLDLGGLGMVVEAEPIIPGVYDAVLEQPETGVGTEAYIVSRCADGISGSAKKYGKEAPGYPELLVYSEDETGNLRCIIGYELSRYKILHQLPMPEDETIRSIAATGAEMYPEYFGRCPAPFLTPWGCTTRNKIIANGVFWLETEQCQRGLAVACPKYDDLSSGAAALAEQFDDGSGRSKEHMPGYLFFKETDSCVPLFELLFWGGEDLLFCEIDRAALMNAIYQFHPEYAAQHNMNEQAGRNDGVGLLLRSMGVDVELQNDPEHLISLTEQAGTEFIAF